MLDPPEPAPLLHDVAAVEEIGQDFELVRERIRCIEAEALRKLRHPSRSKRLRDLALTP